LLIFDKNSLRGNYQVSASYIERVDKSKDVYFEIVDKIETPNHNEEETEFTIESDPTTSNQIEKKADSQIPEWVKIMPDGGLRIILMMKHSSGQ